MIAFLLCAVLSPAQTQRSAAVTSLSELAKKADIIFSGTVLGVEKVDSGGAPTMRVTFEVEDAIRGVSPREILAISQWMGLWTNGERYHVGERVLLFLHRASTAGLTSEVGGDAGRFEADNAGVSFVLTAQQANLLRPEPASDVPVARPARPTRKLPARVVIEQAREAAE